MGENAEYGEETDDSVFIAGTAGNGYEIGFDGAIGRDIHSGNTLLDLVAGEES